MCFSSSIVFLLTALVRVKKINILLWMTDEWLGQKETNTCMHCEKVRLRCCHRHYCCCLLFRPLHPSNKEHIYTRDSFFFFFYNAQINLFTLLHSLIVCFCFDSEKGNRFFSSLPHFHVKMLNFIYKLKKEFQDLLQLHILIQDYLNLHIILCISDL